MVACLSLTGCLSKSAYWFRESLDRPSPLEPSFGHLIQTTGIGRTDP
jgi:hypothetical protein